MGQTSKPQMTKKEPSAPSVGSNGTKEGSHGEETKGNCGAKSRLDYLMNTAKPGVSALLATVHRPDTCYVMVHGAWYDLGTFAARHPGGETALRLGQGRDATALFESSHVFADKTKLAATLAKFRLDDAQARALRLATLESGLVAASAEPPSVSADNDFYGANVPWSFGGPFRAELLAQVRAHFEREAKRRNVSLMASTKATPAKWAFVVSTTLLFWVSIVFLVRGNFLMIVACPLLGWIAGVNTFHDASHFALSTSPAVNAIGGALFPQFASMYAWYHQHIIGHHVHTNMPYHDPDLVHGTDIRREHDLHPLEPLHHNQDNLVRTVWHFMVGSWLGLGGINDMKLIFSSTKSYNGFIPRIPATNLFLVGHVLSRVLYYLAQFGWPFFTFPRGTPFLYRLAFSLLPAMIHSVLFMVNTQINHLSPAAMKASSHDWTVHQIITAQNFGRLDDDNHPLAWLFHFTMSGGLNLQMEHHIFPTVNHCHLPAVARILRPLCAKYGVPYNVVPGYYEGMREYIKHSTMKGGQPLPALAELELLKPDEQSERGLIEHANRDDFKRSEEKGKQEQQQQYALKKTTRTGSISPADIASFLMLVNPVVASLAEQKKEV